MRNSKTVLVLLVFLGIGVLTYSNALRHPFMMDDHAFLTTLKANPRLWYQQLIPDKNKILGVEAKGTDTSYFRPLAHLLPSVSYAAFGKDPFGYHLVNLFLFWFSAVLIFILINNIFKNLWLAFLTGSFYLVHPINGVVVNYITASVFAAQVIFMTGSLMCLWGIVEEGRRRREEGSKNERNKGRNFEFGRAALAAIVSLPSSLVLHLLSILLFALALMCHETAMYLPLYWVALLWIVKKEAPAQIWRHSVALIVFFAAYLVFRAYFASLNGVILKNFVLLHANFLEYAASVAKLAAWYLSKLFYPQGIVLIWATPVVRDGIFVFGWIAGLLALISVLFYWVRRSSDAAAKLGAVWLALGFLPLLLGALISPLQGVLIEPHWFIFSSVGFFLFLAAQCVRWMRVSNVKIWVVLISAVVLVWMGVSRSYNELWSDEERYCLKWSQEAPGFKTVSFFLAQVYESRRDFETARYYYRQSLMNRYKDWKVLLSLGRVDLLDGKYSDAEINFIKALKIEPRSSEALNSLGYIYLKEGKAGQAKKLFAAAMAADRFAVMPRSNLAAVLLKEGRVQEAESLYLENLKVLPRHEGSLVALVKIYFDEGRREDVVRIARGLSVHSRDPLTLTNSGILLDMYGFPSEAVAAFERSMRMAPEYAPAFMQAARVYHKIGKPDQAQAAWSRRPDPK